jgi:hypothetical protein
VTVPILPLDDMHDRHQGLTQRIASYYCEAACVCLDRHYEPPTVFEIEDAPHTSSAEVQWAPTDQRTRDAWANEIDTTEAGAYACVIAAVELVRGYFAVRRAETTTGADYYLGPEGTGADDLESCVRLEVSGMDEGNPQALARRLAAKVRQAATGASLLPAVAGVVGFEAKRILLADVPEQP